MEGCDHMSELREMMLRYRATENISQRELARRANLAVQTINNIERELQNPSELTKMKLRMLIEGNE